MAPDGLAKTVADSAKLKSMNVAFASASDTIKTVAQLLDTTVQGLRSSIEVMGDLDPITEDLLIGISAGLEKHLWMVQAQEK